MGQEASRYEEGEFDRSNGTTHVTIEDQPREIGNHGSPRAVPANHSRYSASTNVSSHFQSRQSSFIEEGERRSNPNETCSAQQLLGQNETKAEAKEKKKKKRKESAKRKQHKTKDRLQSPDNLQGSAIQAAGNPTGEPLEQVQVTEDEGYKRHKRQKIDPKIPVSESHLHGFQSRRAKKNSHSHVSEDVLITMQSKDKVQSELSALNIKNPKKEPTKGTGALSSSEPQSKTVAAIPEANTHLFSRAGRKKHSPKEPRKEKKQRSIAESPDNKGQKHAEKHFHTSKEIVSTDESKASPFDSSSVVSSDIRSKVKMSQSERAKLHSMLLAAVQGRAANRAARDDANQGDARSSKAGESKSSVEMQKYRPRSRDVKERYSGFQNGDMGISKAKKKKKLKYSRKDRGANGEEQTDSPVASQWTVTATQPLISPEQEEPHRATNQKEAKPNIIRDSPQLADRTLLSRTSPIVSQTSQDDHGNEPRSECQTSPDHETLDVDADASRTLLVEEQSLSQIPLTSNPEAPVSQLINSTPTPATEPSISHEAGMQTKHRGPSPVNGSTALANPGFVLDARNNPIVDSEDEHHVTAPMTRASSMEPGEPTRTDQAYVEPGLDDGQFFRDALMEDTPLVPTDDAYAIIAAAPSLDEPPPNDILAEPLIPSLYEFTRYQQNISPELVARAALEHLRQHTFSRPSSISSQQDIESGLSISVHHAANDLTTSDSHLALDVQELYTPPTRSPDALTLENQSGIQPRSRGLGWSIDEYEAILDAAVKYLSSMPSNLRKGITVDSLRSTMDDNPSLAQWFAEMEKAGIDFDRDQLTRVLTSVAPCANLGVTDLDTPASRTQAQSHGNNDQRRNYGRDEPPVTREDSSKELVLSYLSDQLLLHPMKGLLTCLQAFQVHEICRDLGISLTSDSDSVEQTKAPAGAIAEILPEQLAVSNQMSDIEAPDTFTPLQDLEPEQSMESLNTGQETTVGGAEDAKFEMKSSLRRSQRLSLPAKRQTSLAPGISSSRSRRSRIDAREPEPLSQRSAVDNSSFEIGNNRLPGGGSTAAEVDKATNSEPSEQELEEAEDDEDDDFENTLCSQIKKVEDLEPGETFSLSKNGVVTIRVSVSDSPSERAYVKCAKLQVLNGIAKELERSRGTQLKPRERQVAVETAAQSAGDSTGMGGSHYNEVRLQVRHPLKPQDGKCRQCHETAKRWYFDDRVIQWICARCYNKRWRAKNKMEPTSSFYAEPWPPRPKAGRCEHCREVPQRWCFIISLRQWTCKDCYNVQRDEASHNTRTVGFARQSWSQKLREALGEENSLPEDALLLLELRDEQQRSFEWIQSYLAKRGQVETIHVLSKRYQRLKCWIVDLLHPSGSECSEGDAAGLDENEDRERPPKPQNGICQQCSVLTKKWYYRGSADDIKWICTGCYNKDLRARRLPPGVLPRPPRPEKPEDGKCERCHTIPYKWYFDATSHEWICKRCYSSDWLIKKNEQLTAMPNSRNTKKPADGKCQQCSNEPSGDKWYFDKGDQQWQCARCYEHKRYEIRISALPEEMGGSLRKFNKQFQATTTDAGQVEDDDPTAEVIATPRDHAEAHENTEALKTGAEVLEVDDRVSAEEDEDFSEDDLLLLQLREEERRSWPEIQAIFEERGIFESVGTWKTRHQQLRARVDTM